MPSGISPYRGVTARFAAKFAAAACDGFVAFRRSAAESLPDLGPADTVRGELARRLETLERPLPTGPKHTVVIAWFVGHRTRADEQFLHGGDVRPSVAEVELWP